MAGNASTKWAGRGERGGAGPLRRDQSDRLPARPSPGPTAALGLLNARVRPRNAGHESEVTDHAGPCERGTGHGSRTRHRNDVHAGNPLPRRLLENPFGDLMRGGEPVPGGEPTLDPRLISATTLGVGACGVGFESLCLGGRRNQVAAAPRSRLPNATSDASPSGHRLGFVARNLPSPIRRLPTPNFFHPASAVGGGECAASLFAGRRGLKGGDLSNPGRRAARMLCGRRCGAPGWWCRIGPRPGGAGVCSVTSVRAQCPVVASRVELRMRWWAPVWRGPLTPGPSPPSEVRCGGNVDSVEGGAVGRCFAPGC